MKNQSKIFLPLIAISLISACTGQDLKSGEYFTKSDSGHNLNIKNAQVAILNINNLDQLSKTCYSTVHYYDPNMLYGKISLDIADDGSVGGAVFALENSTDSQSKCNFHLYKWQDNFQTLQYANADLDCSDRTLCSMDNYFSKYSNNDIFYGILTATGGGGSFFYTDGITYHLTQERLEFGIAPSFNYKMNVKNDGSFSSVYEYNILNDTSTLIKSFDSNIYDNTIKVNDNRISVVARGNHGYYKSAIINNQNGSIHEYAQYDEQHYQNNAHVLLSTISNNSNYVYGSIYQDKQIGNSHLNQIISLPQIRPNADYAYQTLSAFPFNIENVELKPLQVVNDGTLLISYKKYNLENNQQVSVINKNYFYSSLRGQFYDFSDLLTIFNIQEYSPKITNIKLSENGNYMLLILDKTGKSSNIAIKIKFDNGINDFLVNNLQPVQS